jgi:predicted helicase
MDVLYRPFDCRRIYYSSNLIDRGREKVMQHFLKGENVGLITCRQQSSFDFQHIFVSRLISDMCNISLQTKETGYVFPLYPENTTQQLLEIPVRTPNLDPGILLLIAEKLGLTFTPEKSGRGAIYSPLNTANIQEHNNPYATADNHTFAPIDLLDYIYAVLHSPNYRETYKEFLKIDFPRVPFPDPKTFWPLVKLGAELRQIHLLESPVLDHTLTTYPNDGDNIVTRKINKNDFEITDGRGELIRPGQIQGRVWINGQQYFDGVPLVVWKFYIGGYQPAQKWLKDHHGRKLNFEDIRHYQKVIVALAETHRIMQAIDSIWHPVD